MCLALYKSGAMYMVRDYLFSLHKQACIRNFIEGEGGNSLNSDVSNFRSLAHCKGIKMKPKGGPERPRPPKSALFMGNLPGVSFENSHMYFKWMIGYKLTKQLSREKTVSLSKVKSLANGNEWFYLAKTNQLEFRVDVLFGIF